MRDEAAPKRVRDADALAGQREIQARLARQARQEIGAADIRKEADADLGHREQGLSVPTRWAPFTDMPTPPPMTMPSISAI